MFMRVDFPDPEGPITARKSPARMSRSTSARPTTLPAPPPYTRQTPRSRSSGSPDVADANPAPLREVPDFQRGDHLLALPKTGEDLRPLPVRYSRADLPAGDPPAGDDVHEPRSVPLHHRRG